MSRVFYVVKVVEYFKFISSITKLCDKVSVP